MRTNTVLFVLALVSLAASAAGTQSVKYCKCKDKEMKKRKDKDDGKQRELTDKKNHKTPVPTAAPKEFTLVCPGDKNFVATLPECKKNTTIGADHTCSSCPLPACETVGGRCVSNCKQCQQGCRANTVALGVPFYNNKQCATVEEAACDADQVCCIAQKPLCTDIGGVCNKRCDATSFEMDLKSPKPMLITAPVDDKDIKPLQVAWTDIGRCTTEGEICCTFTAIDEFKDMPDRNPFGVWDCELEKDQKCFTAEEKAKACAAGTYVFQERNVDVERKLLVGGNRNRPANKYFCQDEAKFCGKRVDPMQHEDASSDDATLYDAEFWQVEFADSNKATF